MLIQDFIYSLREQQVKLSLVDDKLSVKTPGKTLSPELIATIKERKEEIINYLKQAGKQSADGKPTAEQFAKIVPVEEQEYYGISHAQRRLWIIEELTGGQGIYNMPYYIDFDDMNRVAFEKSIQALVERHEILRTRFITVNGEAKQLVVDKEEALLPINYVDLRRSANQADSIQQEKQADARRPFNLVDGMPIRVSLLHLDKTKYLVIVNLHHIVFDGWSNDVLRSDFNAFYSYYARLSSKLPAPLQVHYKDYTCWQLMQSVTGAWKKHSTYWHKQFESPAPELSLVTDRPRPAVRSFDGGDVTFFLTDETFAGLQQLCRENGVTMFMLVMAATKVLLHRYGGAEDIVLGTPIAGRDRVELEDQIGFYVNTLALRTRFSAGNSFLEILNKVKETALNAYEHQQYPYDLLVEETGFDRDMSRTPLFDVMALLHSHLNTQVNKALIEGAETIRAKDNMLCRFDLTFNYTECSNAMVIDINYSKLLFSKERIMKMAAHLQQLLTAIIRQPELPVAKLNYLGEEERKQLLHTNNDRKTDYPRTKTIPELFQEQVQKTPDAIAVVYENNRVTYRELDEQSTRLGNLLQTAYNVKPGDLVAIMAGRSMHLMTSILAILKAGAAYLPLDPSYPAKRLKYMLDDANAPLLISEEGYKHIWEDWQELIKTVSLDTIITESKGSATTDLFTSGTPENIAYVMYTSGSTGRPKGAMVSHRSIVRLVKNTDYVTLREGDRLLQTGSLSFDAATFEFYGMLLNGGELHFLSAADLLHTAKMKAKIINDRINIMWLTSSWLNQLVDDDIELFSGLRCLLAGGEKLSPFHINKIKAAYPQLTIVNGYGPTENTTFSICKIIDTIYEDDIPLGRPINNSTAYILDNKLELVPAGVAGEILVGGDGLASGYLNQPELTAERFIDHPFEKGEKLYKTGDLGCWIANNDIRFLARKDNQVKIRGYRIEPGEIETVLAAYATIDRAVVLIKESETAGKFLVAYYSGTETDAEDIKKYAAGRLPAYMVPGHIIYVSAWPLTVNGKIDSNRLPDIETTRKQITSPATQTEEKLLAIWKEVLKTDEIGTTDNFFEIGGHSLKATQIVAKIYKEFAVQIALNDVFDKPTILEMAGLLGVAETETYESIDAVEEQEHYAISNAQQRLWVIEQFEEAKGVYNIPRNIFFSQLDRTIFTKAITAIVDRHEALRTTLVVVNGEPRQRVHSVEESGFHVAYFDLRNHPQQAEQVRYYKDQEESFCFDLSKGPLMRVMLLHLQDNSYRALINMHHIISDGWSAGLMEKEFNLLYDAYNTGSANPLPPLTLQYKDFSCWQKDMLTGGQWDVHRNFWNDQLAGLPVLELATDHPRSQQRSYEGAGTTFLLPAELTEKIAHLSETENASQYMVLLACVKLLLFKYTGQEDIVTGTVIAGRDRAELDDQLGFYVNALTLRTRFDATEGFLKLLQKVKKVTLDAYSHQQYPFDILVDELEYTRSQGRSPLFDVIVDMQNFGEAVSVNGVPAFGDNIAFEPTLVKFDLNFTFIQTDKGIMLNVNYSTGLFEQQRIKNMLGHFVQLLQVVLSDGQTALAKLDYLSAEEKQELVHVFNSSEINTAPAETIIQLFEKQVQANPDTIALLSPGINYTFRELNEKANQLAHYLLQEKKVQKGQFITVLMEPSANRILTLLGILKAGAVYVPVDAEYPLSRTEHILNDTAAKLLIAEKNTLPVIPEAYTGERIEIAVHFDNFKQYSTADPVRNDKPADVFCVLYTSGSTGIPKGVYIHNDGVVNRIDWLWKKFSFTADDVIYQKTGYVFDVSIGEIFMPLTHGAKVLVAPHTSAFEICENIRKYNVTYIHFSPTYLNSFLDGADAESLSKIGTLRYVVASGEALLKQIVRKFYEKISVPLVNLYGPTEASIEVSYFVTSKDDEVIPIGKPIANVQLYVLDKYNNLVPAGIPGEVAIGGIAVSSGYLNQDDKTKERFIDNPVLPGSSYRVYKTGDIGKWNSRGDIEFLGRKDNQISINGLRVELEEIENAMLAHADIAEAAVGFKLNKINQYQLIAYYSRKNKKEEITETATTAKELTADEWMVINRANDTTRIDPDNLQVHQLFESAAASYPGHVALVCQQTQLTYSELNRKANQFADLLKSRYACSNGDRVAIWMTRSERMIIALLAALKLGVTYVPIDPEYPAERVNAILEDAAAKLVITDQPADEINGNKLDYTSAQTQLSGCSTENSNATAPADLAYIMYTSGSTGKPKGVMISREAMADYVQTFLLYFNVRESDTVLQQASLSFDTSVEEIFPVLAAGGKLVVLPEGGRNVDALVAACVYHKATIISTTPLVINELNNHDDRKKLSIRALISGGDALKTSYIDNLFGQTAIYNTYGPTEITVCATFALITDPAACDTIGLPVANHKIYLLDEEMNEVGCGAKGEIYVAGKGLAAGYLNRDEETAKAFIKNPFDANSRLYKTGDMAIRAEDGQLRFIGRKDRQAKIRGYRVEPAEIEKIIAGISGVANSCVIVKEDQSGNKQLIAFYTGSTSVTAKVLRQQLQQLVPAYMVPSYFVALDKFPATANGKIDYAALPMPGELRVDFEFAKGVREFLKQRLPAYMIPASYQELDSLPKTVTGKIDRKKMETIQVENNEEASYRAPATATEQKLAAIWQKILSKEKVGIADNFFELGGNSLKATQIITRIYNEFEVNVSMNTLFNDPTIEGLASVIDKQTKTHTVMEQITVEQLYYPVSYAQRRLWVIEQFEEARGAYNIPLVVDFESLDRKAFDKAIYALIDRHEILRTTFSMIAGEPKQKIWETADLNFAIDYDDLRDQADPLAMARSIADIDAYEAFDLVNGPLLRVKLLQLSDRKYWVIFNQHHIISDGWSLNVLQQEFGELYESFLTGQPSPLPALPIQYKDYTLWQINQYDTGKWAPHRHYWHQQLEGQLPVLELPADYPRPAQKLYEGAETTFLLDQDTIKKLQKICQQNGATVFMGLMAATNILLYRYSGQEDIIIGSPIASRNRMELEGQLGFYVNTLALRTRFNGASDYKSILNNVKQVLLEAYEHQEYPFDLLVDELELERDLTRSPLFDVMILHEAETHARPYKDGFETKHNLVSKFDLTFTFTESADSMTVGINYSTHLFSEQRMTRMAGHLKQLIRKIAEQPSVPAKDISYLTPAENSQLLYDFNGEKTGYPSSKTIFRLIEDQVTKTPDAIAVKYEDRQLTYTELNEKANQVAHYLREKQAIGKQDVVGVMISRTEQLPVILLGILKAGAAYLPLDPGYPPARLAFMSGDASTKAIITDNAVEAIDELKQLAANFNVINFEKEYRDISGQPVDNPSTVSGPGDLAYLIYTSGTTGKPKGVCLTHQNAVALMSWAKREYAASDFTTVFATTSYCFDLSVYEFFYTLAAGKQLRVLQSALELAGWVMKERDILVNTVPSVVQTLLQEGVDLRNVKVLNIAGEPIPAAVIEKLDVEKIEVRNLYGPSEYATYSTCYRFAPGKKTVLIGKPLDNTQVYILDDNGKPVPVGIKGEIFIAGEHLSRGYLNRADLTTERFLDNPFQAGKKLYKTGDVGYWLEDGNIFYIGRKDNQVKLRGFRIELGEIESVFATAKGAEQVAVVIRTSPEGDSYLAAYYTGTETDSNEFKIYLREKLPQYMVPDVFVYLDEFPLSPNGKIDRSKLPDPEMAIEVENYEPPVTDTEKALTTIWQDILKREKIGATDNFFEIGGQSLKAMQIVSRVNADLKANISIKEIFNCPSVRKLAKVIEGNSVSRSSMIQLNKHNPAHANAFFAPPVLGLSTIYRNLAHQLEGKLNCYGLLYTNDNGAPTYKSIEELAKNFIDEIVNLPGNEKITILGYSMGALVAFEMTKELEKRNREVELILLDRGAKDIPGGDLLEVIDSSEFDEAFTEEIQPWSSFIDEKNKGLLRQLFAYNLKLIGRHKIQGTIKADLSVAEALHGEPKTNMQDWAKHTSGSLRHIFLEGSHATVLDGANQAKIIGLFSGIAEEIPEPSF